MPASPRPPATRLEQRIRAGHFVITAEIIPPLSSDRNDLLRKAEPLRGLVDAVNVTDAASARAALSPLAAAALLVEADVEPILQLTCRDRNRIALQGDLIGAAALGVGNLLLLTGDDPKAGDQPETKPVFDLDSAALTQMARRMRDAHELPTGRKVGGAPNFFLGGADAPVDPAPGWRPDKLAGKVASGTEFVQTQFCMDTAVIARYLACLRQAGLSAAPAILVGLAPLRSAKSARWMRDNLFGTIIPDDLIARLEAAADPSAEGQRICVELIEEFAGMDGIAGVHIMAPNNEAAVPAVIAQARQVLPKSRKAGPR
jgi:methylenetetrahydrofolate reductase (NADPH)